MELIKTEENNCVILALVGRLDATNAMDLEKEVRAFFSSVPKSLILSLEKLDYISSAGLRVLLVAAKFAQEKKTKMALCGLSAHVRQVMEIAGFLPLFEVFANCQEAASSLKA